MGNTYVLASTHRFSGCGERAGAPSRMATRRSGREAREAMSRAVQLPRRCRTSTSSALCASGTTWRSHPRRPLPPRRESALREGRHESINTCLAALESALDKPSRPLAAEPSSAGTTGAHSPCAGGPFKNGHYSPRVRADRAHRPPALPAPRGSAALLLRGIAERYPVYRVDPA